MNVFITGASRGIGKEIALKFAAQGADLFLSARTMSKHTAWVDPLRKKYNIDIHMFDADLSKPEDVRFLANAVNQQWKSVDVLVNNAGFFEPGNVLEEEEGTLERTLQVNLNAAYHLTRMLVPGMIEKKRGYIFNICSIAALGAYPNGGSYSISKWAMLGFNNNLREELKTKGISVTAIHPGATMTDSWAGAGIAPERIMEAADIAELIVVSTKLSPQACVEQIVVRPQLGDL